MITAFVVFASSFLKPEFWFDKAGPAAIWVVMAIVFAETGLLVGFFLPGDSLLFFTGFLTSSAASEPHNPFYALAQHVPSIWIVLPLLFIAAICGNQTGYFIGRKIGPALFNRPNSRFFKQENVVKAHEFFTKYGPKSVFLAQFVPIIRTFTPVIAGVSEMDYPIFARWNIFGSLCWAVGVTTLGHFLGQVAIVRDNIDIAIVVLVAISISPMVIEVIRHRRAKADGAGKSRSEPDHVAVGDAER